MRAIINRYTLGQAPTESVDELADEEPLEIRIGGRSISVTMRTPGHDDELAAGFLVTEGIIQRRSDLLSIEPCLHAGEGNVVTVQLEPGAKVDLARLTRHVFASSSCGLCGKATIEAIRHGFDAVAVSDDVMVDAATLLALPERLRAAQATFNRTGGLHAAGIFTLAGELVVAREDVGRHNAVDKVLGFGLLHDLLPFDRHVLMVSGRTSFEIMQKSLAGRVPIVAAVSAPSSLAVEFAESSGQTLVGFLRGDHLNVYSGAKRVRFS